MRVFVNEKKVAFRKRLASIASFVGLGVLILGMLITLRVKPTDPRYGLWIAIALAALMLGFIAAQVGNYNMRRFVGVRLKGAGHAQRPDTVLDKHLKGLDDKYEVYHWLLPADHVILGPAGLFVVVLRHTTDPVIARGDKWRQPFSFRRLLGLFGAEGLGDPVGEALSQTEKLRAWLQKEAPDLVVDIQPLVFFLEPVPITRENPTVPALLPKDLKKYLRTRAREKPLNEETRRQLRDLFRKKVEADE